MTDRVTKEQRSKVMSAVRSKGNRSTELKLIEYFRKKGIKGWRRNYSLPGRPDFAFPKLRIVVFADGCFWHGHDCRNTTPATRKEYWEAKIKRNIERDREVVEKLKAQNWRVIRIWECEIAKKDYQKLEILSLKRESHMPVKTSNEILGSGEPHDM